MRKFISYTGLLGAILAIACGLLLLTRLMTFRAELDQLNSDGFPVSLLELSVPIPNDGPDGAEAFRRLEGPLVAYETEMYEDENFDRDVDDAMIKRYHELDEAYPTVLPLIGEIVDAGQVSFEVDGDDSQTVLDEKVMSMQRVRSCARVLGFKSRVLAAEGDPDAGLRAAIDILKITAAFESRPTMVAQLVRTACRGIGFSAAHQIVANYQVSAEARSELNQALEAFEISNQFKQALVTERAFGVTFISEMGTIRTAFDGVAYLEVLQNEIDQCQLESFEQHHSGTDDFSWIDGWAASSIIPALQQTRHAHFRMRSQARALRIISALLASPESAKKQPAEITVEYLKTIGVPASMTVDTMDGKPMKIKRVDDRWVVYSVGQDGVDDGGNVDQNLDFGISE